MATRRTFCRVCHAACPLEADVVDGRLVEVRGDRSDPLFEGYTCVKGRALPEQHADPGRLLASLRADGGRFVPVPTATLLDDVADRIAAIVARDGPRAVATYVGTGGYQASAALVTALQWHRAIGSPSFHTSVTIDQPARTTAALRIGAWEAGTHSFRSSDVTIAIGFNPLVSSYAPLGGPQGTNPLVEVRRAKARGWKLVVVDPRRTELAAHADLHLQVLPGEDAPLVAGRCTWCSASTGTTPSLRPPRRRARRAPGGRGSVHPGVRCGPLRRGRRGRGGGRPPVRRRSPGRGGHRHRPEHGPALQPDGAPRAGPQHGVRAGEPSGGAGEQPRHPER